MRTRSQNPFTTVTTAGLLLPVDLLTRIVEGDPDLPGLTPKDYHLHGGERLNEAASRAWNQCQAAWKAFRKRFAQLPASDAGTTVTRDEWLLPLFQELGYGRLQTKPTIKFEDKEYPVSHGWENHVPIHLLSARYPLDRRTPGVAGAAARSPYSMIQELLNRSAQHRWGFVSNGLKLFVLRDNAALARAANVEFDLEAMMDGEIYANFMLLFLLGHQSRIEILPRTAFASGRGSRGKRGKSTAADAADDEQADQPEAEDHSGPENCWLEKWSHQADQQGTRAREKLRDGVEAAIRSLGAGFLTTKGNNALRDRLRSGELAIQDYYRQLLRLVYRLLMLLVAEQKKTESGDSLLHPTGTNAATRDRYARFYSAGRIRTLAGQRRGTSHTDLYGSLKVLFLKMRDGYAPLGIPGFGSFLFSPAATLDLDAAGLANQDLLDAFRHLCYTADTSGRGGAVRRPVDFGNLGSEELGSVYESLLELHPQIDTDAGPFTLGTAAGHERKTTGSYYTPTSLINCLLDSALDPVVEDRLKEADRLAGGEWRTEAEQREALQVVYHDAAFYHDAASWDVSPIRPPDSAPTPEPAPAQLAAEATAAYIAARAPQWEKTPLATRYARLAEHALLDMKICDPACGSGHFLIAAAERMATHLARLRTGDDQPGTLDIQHAKRDIIGRCIYGVDLNPMAVELCKVSLWMEALEPGKPLSFLDHHIQCGNSLLGATPKLLADGIPDDAFKPIEGDEKTVCSQLKKDNKRERAEYKSGQGYLFDPPFKLGNAASEFARLTAASDDSVQSLTAKEQRYARLIKSADYCNARLWADTWCAAFVWKKDKTDLGQHCPTERKFRDIERNPHNLLPPVRAEIERLRDQYQFFHWHLAFPDVFRVGPDYPTTDEQTHWTGGFDVTVGNPPWEMPEVDDREFFATRAPQVSSESSAKQRGVMIRRLSETEPSLYRDWQLHLRRYQGERAFFSSSGRYPAAGSGRLNYYKMFVENGWETVEPRGRLGMIVPSGLTTNAYERPLWHALVKPGHVAAVLDFLNRASLFPAVDTRMKFSLLTLSRASQRAFKTGCWLQDVAEISSPDRVMSLGIDELSQFSPDELAMPQFRCRRDLQLLRAASTDQGPLSAHPDWSYTPRLMFSSSDAAFRPVDSSVVADSTLSLQNRRLTSTNDVLVPVYEGKMVGLLDHRQADIYLNPKNPARPAQERPLSDEQKADPTRFAVPQHWLNETSVRDRRFSKTQGDWQLVFCDVTSATNERTALPCIIPLSGLTRNLPSIYLNTADAADAALLAAVLSSFTLDFFARLKVSSNHLTQGILATLPVPSSHRIREFARKLGDDRWFECRVIELIYTAWDLEPFAVECGYAGTPFRWESGRRFLLRCEIDAACFQLYGISRDDASYIMDTFSTLRRRDQEAHSGYRTRDVILELYDQIGQGLAQNQPFQTEIVPLPAADAARHGIRFPKT